MWRKWFKPFGACVVITADFDGKIRYRFAKQTPVGLVCKSIIYLDVKCNEDGTTSGCSYVRRWAQL